MSLDGGRPLRFGILGAARIAPTALIAPAKRSADATVAAVAAREAERAYRFAGQHDIPRVHGSYEALIADPDIDAIYNPLPNSHHAAWTIAALEAGKHVLCEKPIAATVAEAEEMAETAARTGRVLVEAFHYRYHPLFARLCAIIAAGEVGEVRHVEAHLCFPLLKRDDIRYRADLAGGALMDAGCYPVHFLRHLTGGEPEVVRASALWTRGGVDRALTAELRFPGGRTGRLTCSLLSRSLIRATARVIGTAGEIHVLNPWAPQYFHRLRLVNAAMGRSERVFGPPSYDCQLAAFVAAVRDGTPVPTSAADGIANMRAIEKIYLAAGGQGMARAAQRVRSMHPAMGPPPAATSATSHPAT